MEINISTKKIVLFYLFTVILLTVFSMVGQIYIYYFGGHSHYLVHMFNLDEEYNIPSCFQSGTLLFCSVLLLAIALNKKGSNDRFRFHWSLLAVIFFLMSVDELLSFHENAGGHVRAMFHTGGFLYFAWVLPAILFLIIFAFIYYKFIFDLPAKYRNLFIIGGVIYVIGSLGFEMIGGDIRKLFSEKSFTYAVLTNIEEFFEMSGILIFTYALLDYIKVNIGEFKMKIVGYK
jgi:hypothetical protein